MTKLAASNGQSLRGNRVQSASRQRSAFPGRVSPVVPPSTAPAGPQLELSLDPVRLQAESASRRTPSRRQRHLARALWWFQHMRQVVESACEWQPAPQPPPEQIWFPDTHRQPAKSS